MAKKEWETFEDQCLAYLSNKYGEQCTFEGKGGHDSTASDICVIQNGHQKFCIEVKQADAQSGQFVLYPNEKTQTFDFSRGNVCPIESCKAIINHMNSHYEKYRVLTTKGVPVDISESLMYDWVKYYYSACKKESYFITSFNQDYVIVPIEKIEQYFDISCTYRIKRSGSGVPTSNNQSEIEQLLKDNGLKHGVVTFQDGKCQVNIDHANKTLTLTGTSYRYKFDQMKDNLYNVRRLSNTANANVIFSLHAKSPQQPEDLKQFEEDLLK